MSSAERFQKPAVEDDGNQEPGREVEVGRTTRTRTTRRFEVGFFIRKIRNGEVVFYKTIPSYDDAEAGQRPVVRRAVMAPGGGGGAAGGGAEEQPTITPMNGPGQPNDDTGPVGGTSTKVEVGFFAGTTTTTTTSTDED